MVSLHPVILACIGALGLLLFGLGLAVSMARFRGRVGIGASPDPDAMLNRLVRAHGNAAEYIPFLAVLFLVLGMHAPTPLVLALVVAVTAARFLHASGMLTARTLTRASALRFIGAASTYIIGAWLSILVLLRV